MSGYFARRLSRKFALSVVGLAFGVSAALGVFSYFSARTALEAEILGKLDAVRQNKADQVLNFVSANITNAVMLAREPEVTEAVRKLIAYHQSSGGTATGPYDTKRDAYRRLHAELAPPLANRRATKGFDDVILICAEHGHVMFTLDEEADLGTNLRAGPFRNSSLARAWEGVIRTGRPAVEDYSFYSGDTLPDLFIATPVLDARRRVVAVLAEEVSSGALADILRHEAGFGATGEILLVGEDRLMRSNPRLAPPNSILRTRANTEGVNRAFAGQRGAGILIDYRGKRTVNSYSLVGLRSLGLGFDWALVAKQDVAEALAPLAGLAVQTFGGVGAAMLVALLVGLYLARRTAKSVVEIAAVADAVAGGDLDTPIAVSGPDEIGQLAESVRRMQTALRETLAANTRAAAEQRKTSAYVRSLIEASLDPLVTIGPDGRITDVNRATEEATGVSRAQLLGTDFAEYFTEPDQARAGYHRVFKEEVVRDYALQLRHRDGRVMPVAYNASVYRDEAGAVVGVFAAARDVSEITRAEIEPREARYGVILSTAMDGFWIVGMDGRLLEVNEAYSRMSGYSREELLTMRISDVECVENAEATARHVAKVAREGRDRFETRHRRKDGTVYDVEASAQALPLDGGRLVAFLRDISARKAAEEALQQSEKKYRDLVENALVGVFQTTLQGDILYANDTTLRMFDFDSFEEMAAGGAVIRYKNPKDRQVLLDRLKNAGKTGDFEYEALTKTGRTKSLLLSAALANGVLTGMVLDITERKAAEERIKRAAADLERSNRELEQFAYVASHDLQEPLRMVSSYTQLLARRYEGQLDANAKKYIDYAVDGAVRMQRLINDLLAYSRAGRPGKALEPVDAHAALGDAVRNLAATIEENRALVTSDDLPTVRADASLLVQLLQNLIANAIKFHGEEPPRVHVSARDDEGQWVFSVRDNGIGIERQYADRVFAIFQRLHTKQEYPGTGIGLALSKRIVERHGGTIWFESELGNGSTFFFTVPK